LPKGRRKSVDIDSRPNSRKLFTYTHNRSASELYNSSSAYDINSTSPLQQQSSILPSKQYEENLSKFTLYQNNRLKKIMHTLDDIETETNDNNVTEGGTRSRSNSRPHTSFEIRDSKNDGTFITELSQPVTRKRLPQHSIPVDNTNISADDVLEKKRARLDHLMTKRDEPDNLFIRPKTVSDIMKDSKRSESNLSKETSSSYSKKHLDQKKGPLRDVTKEQLEKKLQEYRTNEKKLAELEQRVAIYKQEKKLEQPFFENKVEQNKKRIPNYTPEFKKRQLEMKSTELNNKIEYVQARRDELEREYLERTRIDILGKRERRDERDLESIVTTYVEAWYNIIMISKTIEYFTKGFDRLQLSKLEQEIQRQEELRLERLREIKRQEEAELRRNFIVKYKDQLAVLHKYLIPAVMRWRQKRHRKNIGVLKAFLTDLTETFKIPLAMTRFRNSVLKIQKHYREYRVMTSARILLIKLQVDEHISKKLDSIERKINAEKKKIHGASMGAHNSAKSNLSKGLERRQSIMQNTQLSLRYLMNQRGSSVLLFELLAKKEELKKIDNETRIRFIRDDMNTRRKRYLEQLERYERYLEASDSETDEDDDVYIPLREPHFQLLLDKPSLIQLVDKMWAYSKTNILRKRNEQAQTQKRRGSRKLRNDLETLFSQGYERHSPTRSLFINSNNFEFPTAQNSVPSPITTEIIPSSPPPPHTDSNNTSIAGDESSDT
jgi:hypothetical protein